MTGPDRPDPPGPGDDRPSWMGAPGYVPPPDLPPHAPMPGAPPYPPGVAPPPPEISGPALRTRFRTALAASAVWGVVLVVLVLLVSGPPPGARVFGALVGSAVFTSLITATVVWAIVRRRTWAFWVLVLLAAPVFWILRAVVVIT